MAKKVDRVSFSLACLTACGLLSIVAPALGENGASSAIAASPTGSQGASTEPTAYDLSLITIEERSPEADDVYRAVSKAVAVIPLKVKRQLTDAGISWVICPTLVEYDPSLANVQSRGWAPGKDFRYVAGTYSFKHNKVLIAVRALRTSDSVMATRGHRLETTLHESGHAYDHVLNKYSRDPVFRAAYEADCARLNDTQRQKLKYFLQAGDAGPSETFAELFAKSLLLKAKLPIEVPNGLESAFPNTLGVMEKLLK